MSAPWLTQVLGPDPAPQVVSVRRNAAPTPTTPTAASASGTGQPFNLQALLAKLQGSYDSANADSLAQYNNLLGAVGNTGNKILGSGGYYDQAQGLLSTLGQTQSRKIDEGATKDLASSEQGLVSRGLGNTTIRDTTRRGIKSDATNAQSALAEQVAGAKSGLLTQRAGAESRQGNLLADSILSRQNTTPDASLYAQLIAQLAQAGGTQRSFPQGGSSGGTTIPSGGGGSYGGGSGSPGSPSKPTGGGGGSEGAGGVQTFTNTGADWSSGGAKNQIDKIRGTLSGYRSTPTQNTSAGSGSPQGLVFFPFGSVVPNNGKDWQGPFKEDGTPSGGSYSGNYWRPPAGYNPATPTVPPATGGR